MKRQDYERISHAIRVERDNGIAGFADAKTAAQIKLSFRMLAVRLAEDFVDVNPRFKVDQFLIDALGEAEAELASTRLRSETGNGTRG